MCRFAAYAGSPEALSSLLYDPPHALERQSYLPREMVSGNVNVDGTGVAWWREGEVEPLCYVSDKPPWSDPNLGSLAPRLRGSPILAAVRSQTPGMPAGVGAVHPFVHEGWAGAHNGHVERFDEFRFDMIGELAAETRRGLDTLTDSIVLFAIAVDALRNGASLEQAVTASASAMIERCAAVAAAASLNLVLASADEVVALRAARGVEPNSLYTLEAGSRWPSGNVVASEPLDDDSAWHAVPEDHIVRLTADSLKVDRVSLPG